MITKKQVKMNDLKFPVLEIYKGSPFPCSSMDCLLTTTSLALRKGFFNDLKIIDSKGNEFLVKGAKKIRTVSRFYEIIMLFNPVIKVNLDIEETGRIFTIEEVKNLILSDFKKWQGWGSRGDFVCLKTSVENARTIAEIIQITAS